MSELRFLCIRTDPSGLRCLGALGVFLGILLFASASGCGPTKAEEHYNAGVRAVRQGDWQKGIEEYSEAIRLRRNFALAYNNRGVAQAILGNYQEAIQDYSEAVQLDPKLLDAYNNRGAAYTDIGEYQKAIADLDLAIGVDPWQARFHFNRAIAFYHLGDYKAALRDLDKTISINTQYVEAFKYRGLTYMEQQDYTRASEDFSLALLMALSKLERDPTSTSLSRQVAGLYFERGKANQAAGDRADALADVQKAIELDPTLELAARDMGISP